MADYPTKLQYYIERLASLRSERDSSWIPHWRDLSDFLLTRQSRFLTSDRNRGDKRNQKIVNETGTLALRTLSSGMMSGHTNPGRPWFSLTTPDPALNEYKPVQMWLNIFRDRMLEVFIRSNLYSILPMAYRDQGCYGTTAYLMLEDDEDLVRFYHFPIGSYMLACDDRGRVDTCYREFEMTARQMVRKFGVDNCSITVQKMASTPSDKEQWIPVVHAIESNPDYDPRKSHVAQYKAYKSCYFEYASNERKVFLKESGFDRFRVLAPRWDVIGEDVYGCSPGMDVLGTVRQLQLRERRKSQLIDKGTNPPMGAPVSLRKKRSSVLPGDVTYYEQTAVNQKFEPLYEPDPRYYQWVLEDINSCSSRIRKGLFEDLFLMMAAIDKTNITAREIAEKQEEKLLQLGPVMTRQNDENFDPLVSMTADIMFRQGVVPPAPPELRGKALTVKYNSIFTQALQMVGVSSIEKLVGFIGSIAAGKPTAADNFDEDAAVTEYAKALGSPPNLIRDKQEVYQIRSDRQRQQQMLMAMQQAQPMIENLKTLSQTNTSTDNALTRLTGSQPQQQPAGGNT
jgi:hypothetical protein